MALSAPSAFTLAADGSLLVIDAGVLVRVRDGGAPAPLLSGPLAVDGNPFLPVTPTVAPDGTILLVARDTGPDSLNHRDAIFRVTPGGQAELVFRSIGNINTVARGADGTLLVAETDMVSLSEFRGRVSRVAPDGTVGEVAPVAPDLANGQVWLDQGRFVFARPRYLPNYQVAYQPVRIEADGTHTALPEVGALPPFTDAQGRTYAVDGTIRRTDPTSGATEILAGPGGRYFTGTGVDDGIGTVAGLMFGPGGDLYFLDKTGRQIKRLPAEGL